MRDKEAERWLSILANLGHAANTILAYRRALNAYFEFCDLGGKPVQAATSEDIALFVRSMTDCRSPAGSGLTAARSGLANATMRQRLTAVRLYYDHLVEEGIRSDNPVGRGRYTQSGGFGGARPRALLPRYTACPGSRTVRNGKQCCKRPKLGPGATASCLRWPMMRGFGARSFVRQRLKAKLAALNIELKSQLAGLLTSLSSSSTT